MATLYKRLLHYSHMQKKPMLTQEQRFELGKRINDAFRASEYSTMLVFKIPTKEPEGEYKSISYPSKFNEILDKKIDEYYKEHSPPPKRERKRKPLNRTPENKRFKQTYLKPK